MKSHLQHEIHANYIHHSKNMHLNYFCWPMLIRASVCTFVHTFKILLKYNTNMLNLKLI